MYINHPSIHPPTCPANHLSIRWHTNVSIYHPPTFPVHSLNLFGETRAYLSTYARTHAHAPGSSIYQSTRLAHHPFIHPVIHPSSISTHPIRSNPLLFREILIYLMCVVCPIRYNPLLFQGILIYLMCVVCSIRSNLLLFRKQSLN